jgi:hypothetical protein
VESIILKKYAGYHFPLILRNIRARFAKIWAYISLIFDFLWISRAGVGNPRTKYKFLRPKLESRISDFSIFLVYFPSILLSCGPNSQYFWQIFQVAAHRPIWDGQPCSRQWQSASKLKLDDQNLAFKGP